VDLTAAASERALLRRRRRGAIELPGARRRRERAERRTYALGIVALLTTGAVVVTEFAHVWRRGSAPTPIEGGPVLAAAETAVHETLEVAAAGYRSGSLRENALLNLLWSFTITFGIVRASTHSIRRHGRFGPFRNMRVAEQHVHHFVPGITLAFLAGGISLASRAEALDPWLAIPFGTGVAMTLDESALLLKLDDVYWTEDGIVSVQITLAALAMLSALALTRRVLRRGEAAVLPAEDEPVPGSAAPALRAVG
jgi:hypothetical protein